MKLASGFIIVRRWRGTLGASATLCPIGHIKGGIQGQPWTRLGTAAGWLGVTALQAVIASEALVDRRRVAVGA